MAWQKKNTAEHKEILDLRTGMHVVPLHDPVSGAEHKLQINVGHDSCPHCGHCMPKTNLDELDVPKLIAEEIASLSASHANIRKYAQKHGVPMRGSK